MEGHLKAFFLKLLVQQELGELIKKGHQLDFWDWKGLKGN